ncbi:STAS domain-containing protein [Micromonospora robiginosa]|uniref:STAS domain-containing protein n=1 Tax=Micromonospora robiginosa TaxID=2749844 RepID=A0A7L6B0P1_9ACTN|nr:STAS domain-containing protein [Micromonospora ferruginea]QLQ35507.2 STAS domain-containing protein [Micromonospora ferruginea]
MVVSQRRKPEAAPLTISVDRSDPAAPVVGVGGDLAYATSAPLRAEVDRLLAERPAALVFDFGGLNFCDSTGLSVIVHAWREGQQAGTAIELRAVPRFLETILDMTGVTGLLDRSPVDGRSASGSAASA